MLLLIISARSFLICKHTQERLWEKVIKIVRSNYEYIDNQKIMFNLKLEL